MKNKRRFIATLLAITLSMTVFAFPAFANSGDSGNMQSGDTNRDDPSESAQSVTVNVVENSDGSRTVTIGNQSWTLDDDPEKTGKVVNVRSYLNLRTGPSTNYSIIGHLLNGTEVEVLGESNGWYEIVIPEKKGYVCGDYLQVSSATTSSTNNKDKLLEVLLQYYSTGATPAVTVNSGNTANSNTNAFNATSSSGSSASLTPDGNLTLVDDIGAEVSSGQQFITVQSKAGNTFYVIIDRDDHDNQNVHFLNLVDEADLLALTEDGETIVPTCTCTDKCTVGSINTNCSVCCTNMSKCAGKETIAEIKPEPTADSTENSSEKKSGGSGIIVVVLLFLLGGGGALYWFKLRDPKTDARGSDDLDDYDYGEDDEDEEYEYEHEENVTEEEAEE